MLIASLSALLSVVSIPVQQAQPLRVLRASPLGTVDPVVEVVITFDRPVAARLNGSLDPGSIFRIEPAVEGLLEWRDPVTIRFTPHEPLTPRQSYQVTVSPDFEAMDGSRLPEPYELRFRIAGPRVLDGWPVWHGRSAQHLEQNQQFELLVGPPPDAEMTAMLVSSTMLRFRRSGCRPYRIPFSHVETRALTEADIQRYRRTTRHPTYRDHPELLRVVVLQPTLTMPRDCPGELSLPHDLERVETTAWSLRTHGSFSLADATCERGGECPVGPVRVRFTTPVRGADVARYLRIEPGAIRPSVRDTLSERTDWDLEAELAPRSSYVVMADPALRDIFGQPIVGASIAPFQTTGYPSAISYPRGRWLVERLGNRTVAVGHVNVDSLEVKVAPIPRALEHRFMSGSRRNWRELWDSISGSAPSRVVVTGGAPDERYVTGVRLPAYDARRPDGATLMAVSFTTFGEDGQPRPQRGFTIAQVTNLAVHARLGFRDGAAWVTGVDDGLPRQGAHVKLYDHNGNDLAAGVTDSDGMVHFSDFVHAGGSGFRGSVTAELGGDRAIATVNTWDPHLSPWQFGVRAAYGHERKPVAGALFTERGIYRPGEPVHAKAIARVGNLGELKPAAGDSLHWTFKDRDGNSIADTIVALSRFGTSDRVLDLPTDAPLGQYRVEARLKEGEMWHTLPRTEFRVAEYRPPEFLVDATADGADRLSGEAFEIDFEARYLFGAPMGRALASWAVREQPVSVWSLRIPDTEGYYVGVWGRWWGGSGEDRSVRTVSRGEDTLDASGHLRISLQAPEPRGGTPARVTAEATVVDVNRQQVSGQTTLTVHPASFYIAAKPEGRRYFWREGEPQTVSVLAVAPDGERVAGVPIRGTIVRREWHRVRRQRGGYYEYVGEWVSDTVATCSLTSAAAPASCDFTPPSPGSYNISFEASDRAGRVAKSGFYRWTVGEDWVPWYDATQFKMDVITDRQRYSVGDTAEILFASPFTDADAWITVEREGLIEQRKIHITSGTTTLRLPITEIHAPNIFVSILVARGRSAPPGATDDPGRPTMRVGYAELRVAPEVKRLNVAIRPLQDEYRPGDTARVELAVRDVNGVGHESEVTLWAVDEGVLALTGYKTPDPIDLIYRARGLGVRLGSNLTAVVEQMAAEELSQKGEPGGGGGMDVSGILRSRFKSTAFFLGSVVTDANGDAEIAAKLPDNLTTFRVMAVAVTEGDRYGSGASSLLVTRPLLARPALPRFLREGDDFRAGVIVNHRLGGTPRVKVETEVEDVRLVGASEQDVTLEAGRGSEARFAFIGVGAGSADSATFRFKVSSGDEADAVQKRLAIRPAYHPVGHTIAGILWDTESAEFVLPSGIDPERSTLELSIAGSPLATIRGARRELAIYPYYCSEQVSSVALPLIALYRAQQSTGTQLLEGNPRVEIEEAVQILSRRQRDDGGIGLWNSQGFTSPWLTSYVGRVLLEARAAGVAVNDTVLSRIGEYLRASLHQELEQTHLASWHNRYRRIRLTENVAAVDFLSHIGTPDLSSENSLFARAAQMGWEDRAWLAEVLARRGRTDEARRLLASVWDDVIIDGRRAVLPDSAYTPFYFGSRVRPAARLLTATLAVNPTHELVAPLLETLVARGRQGMRYRWNTQDYSAAVLALLRYEEIRTALPDREVRVESAGQSLAKTGTESTVPFDTVRSLEGLLLERSDGSMALRLTMTSSKRGAPAYYHFTVREVLKERPVTPVFNGIDVERWYERYDDPTPITSAEVGELVRVRLRITVPEERHMLVLDDALPAGLEAVDISLKTVGDLPDANDAGQRGGRQGWYGTWEYGRWSPFDHKELRDDRVVYFATTLRAGTYFASYVARATTPGTFVLPPVHAEEMYDAGINGRSEGGTFMIMAASR